MVDFTTATTATPFELLLQGLPAVSLRQNDLEVSEWSLGYWGVPTIVDAFVDEFDSGDTFE